MQLNSEHEDALREIFSIGIGRAAARLSELISTRIEMTVPHVSLRLLDHAPDFWVSTIDGPEMAVIQDFQGTISGRAALVLPHISGLRLAQLLGDVAQPVDELDLEMSGILTEVGNIMLNSVLGTIANIVGTHFNYSIPSFYSARPVNSLLFRSTQRPRALITADAEFLVRHDKVNGSLLVVLETNELGAILDAVCKVEV